MLSTENNLEIFKNLSVWEYTRELEAIKKIKLNGDEMEKKETKSKRDRKSVV